MGVDQDTDGGNPLLCALLLTVSATEAVEQGSVAPKATPTGCYLIMAIEYTSSHHLGTTNPSVRRAPEAQNQTAAK